VKLPISFFPAADPLERFEGATREEVEPFYRPNDPVRRIERASIRTFMLKHRELLSGCVLDFGAGKQPYRDLVKGEYVPYEPPGELDQERFDAAMCNQVMQYVLNPPVALYGIRKALKPGGHLLLTYPTNWAEVEATDLCRFTRAGMERLLDGAGFNVIAHELRAEVVVAGTFRFALGYGAVARKT